ncbi:MAG TPA: TolC family outer membrane protein [Burkholderiales bacterium]|nr:TolC family outer membrane protein [Burkholderiales bacterium]
MPGPGPSIRQSRCIRSLALASALAAAALPAAAEDLLQVYRDAQRYDAVYNGARFTLEAGRERIPQARALLLPSLNLTANAASQRIEVESSNTAVTPSFVRSPNTAGYSLTLAQPVYRPQNFAQWHQADYQVRQSEAVFGQATQDLGLRVAQAYFDVQAAQDTLGLVGAQKAAISEQLAQAKRNFEVGTATITDTHEAQARYDLIIAQEIAAQNDVENKRRALQAITGKEYSQLKPMRPDVRMTPPSPADMQSWVEIAEKQAYPVLAQEAATEVAQLEAKRASAGHLPTVDIVGSYGTTRDTGSLQQPVGRETTTGQIGLQLAVPLYQGGSLSSREREAAANYLRSRQDLENARRTAVLNTRQSYLSVINGIAQIGALEQALTSSQSALDSNRLGYEVGVRINIDVLNAQQQLFSTRRDLAVARYNAILNHLRLKAAAGTLREEDLEEVNRALQP